LSEARRCPKPDGDGKEKIMKIRIFLALALALLAVSACVIEPMGAGHAHYGDRRGYFNGGDGNYGGGYERGVWRG
jgi:hypothetical protein